MKKYDEFFDGLCDMYYRNVYKYIVFSVKDRDAADDIVQDTFVVVYRNIEKVYRHNDPGGFIFKTAQNIIKNYKKEIYKKLLNEISSDDSSRDIKDNSASIENYIDADVNEYEYVWDIINSLDEKSRRLYKMHYIDKKSLKEIAESEGTEYTAMRMRFVRLRREIKEKVKEFAENNFVT